MFKAVMQGWNRKTGSRARMWTIGAAFVTVSAAMTSPASASTSGWFGLETYYNNGAGLSVDFCMDSNANKQAYVNPCQVPGNKYQDWTWQAYSGGYYQIKDEATGYCLDSNASGQVYTNPCQTPGNLYQDWYMPNKPGTTFVQDRATGLELALDDPSPSAPVHTISPNGSAWSLIQ
ncbi:RICIN domain-containing protein [Streptomyces sp. NPDC091217]|uniref:RICIN domain-containing protein n=1 Tax=Streptomyces sp. NPDC091217 TaxID=3365975 RepID=UPI00380A0238